MTEFIGAKISLISRSDIRYVGILHEINSEESTVALEQVRSFGTEGRRGKDEVPPSDNVFEYIVFRGSDVKDLKVEEAAKKVEPPPRGVPDDPAILATTAPPPRTQHSPVYPPMHQYPPPPPGYGNYQYPPPPFGGPGGFRPPPQHMSPPQGYQYNNPNYPPGMPPPPRGYPGPNIPMDQQQQPPAQPPTTSPPPPAQQPLPPAPSPVKETKPDVATATAAPPITIKPTATQPTAKQAAVVPAMPIPISIPRPTKPTSQQSPPPSTAPQIVDTAKVTTAADVQSLAKNLSETKFTSTSNVPGAGGYLTQPTRRRQFNAAAANQPNMDQDYDFESANAKFNKEEIAKEVAAAQTTINGTDETSPVTGPSAAQLASALSDEKYYDKGKSFFDNISCENKDRTAAKQTSQDGSANPNTWKRGEERKLNMETFGQASIDYGGGRYGRGGGYRGGRGGYRGGRGGGGYYGGRGSRGASQSPWRGGPRANGQNTTSSETTSA